MCEIEKILIKQDDKDEMKRAKEKNMEVCSRYTRNMSQSRVNIQKIKEQRKLSVGRTTYSKESWVPSETFYQPPKSALALRHELCTKHKDGPDPYEVLADKFYPKVQSHTYSANFYK